MQSLQDQAREKVERFRDERSKFIKLIHEQESVAAQDPIRYRRKVVAFAWLGYGYIVCVLFLLLVVLAALVYALFFAKGPKVIEIKVGLLILPIVYYVFRSLFVKLDFPQGINVSRHDAPLLWAEVDSLAETLGAPRVDGIFLQTEVNACAVQMPRFGLLGFYRNYLFIGLPLLYVLSPNELKSVIAHEFGHFDGQHGRVGGWIYRLSETFRRIRESMDGRGGNMLFTNFFDWFEPRFDAISFVLRRQNEYAADAAALRLAGRIPAANALMRLSYGSRLMERAHWTELAKRSKQEPEPPQDSFLGLPDRLARAISSAEIQSCLNRELAIETGFDDSHPSLAARLTAMSAMPDSLEVKATELESPLERTAADHYFQDQAQGFLVQFSKEFAEANQEIWAEQFRQNQLELVELQELEGKQATVPLTKKERAALGSLVNRLRSPTEAITIFRALVQDYPADAEANFGLGEALLEIKDREGEDFLRKAVSQNIELLDAAIGLIAAYRTEHGDQGDLEALYEEFVEQAHVAQLVRQSKWNFFLNDDFVTAPIEPADRDKLRQQLEKMDKVKRAWLAAKVVPYPNVEPASVILVEPVRSYKLDNGWNQRVAESVLESLDFKDQIAVICPDSLKPWIKRLSEVPNSLICDSRH